MSGLTLKLCDLFGSGTTTSSATVIIEHFENYVPVVEVQPEPHEHPRETRRRQQPFYRGLKKYRKHL